MLNETPAPPPNARSGYTNVEDTYVSETVLSKANRLWNEAQALSPEKANTAARDPTLTLDDEEAIRREQRRHQQITNALMHPSTNANSPRKQSDDNTPIRPQAPAIPRQHGATPRTQPVQWYKDKEAFESLTSPAASLKSVTDRKQKEDDIAELNALKRRAHRLNQTAVDRKLAFDEPHPVKHEPAPPPRKPVPASVALKTGSFGPKEPQKVASAADSAAAVNPLFGDRFGIASMVDCRLHAAATSAAKNDDADGTPSSAADKKCDELSPTKMVHHMFATSRLPGKAVTTIFNNIAARAAIQQLSSNNVSASRAPVEELRYAAHRRHLSGVVERSLLFAAAPRVASAPGAIAVASELEFAVKQAVLRKRTTRMLQPVEKLDPDCVRECLTGASSAMVAAQGSGGRRLANISIVGGELGAAVRRVSDLPAAAGTSLALFSAQGSMSPSSIAEKLMVGTQRGSPNNRTSGSHTAVDLTKFAAVLQAAALRPREEAEPIARSDETNGTAGNDGSPAATSASSTPSHTPGLWSMMIKVKRTPLLSTLLLQV